MLQEDTTAIHFSPTFPDCLCSVEDLMLSPSPWELSGMTAFFTPEGNLVPCCLITCQQL